MLMTQELIDGRLTLQTGLWTRNKICAAPSPSRGSLAASKEGDIYAVLPDPSTLTLRIYKSSKDSNIRNFSEVWAGQDYFGEPLIDRQRLDQDGVLSIFIIQVRYESQTDRRVVVIDFTL